jgi:hypothetical protein
MNAEGRLGFVHRVIANRSGLKEYAILITDKRSIFIRLSQSRSGWMLRIETWFGSAVITDVQPKTLEDYAGTETDSLATDSGNFTIPHEKITELSVSVGRMYPVYRLDLHYMDSARKVAFPFYPVPLGVYMLDRRLTQAREVILRQYVGEVLSSYRRVLSSSVTADASPAH